MATIYSADEVSKHNKKNDLWMTIHNKVYNVTEFIIEHPGGEEVLLDEAGKDATESFEDIGHSDEAREILSKYLVGELDEASRSVRTDYNKLRAGELPVEKKQSGSALRVILPALAVIGIIAYKFILAPKQV
ncbi:cytochrome b5-like heme/steroid binding domain-containing protein [Pilaira anomala]|nr:cytochrome b5-like heme/steroid binding domain-containing protein [Pilaira anomala]